MTLHYACIVENNLWKPNRTWTSRRNAILKFKIGCINKTYLLLFPIRNACAIVWSYVLKRSRHSSINKQYTRRRDQLKHRNSINLWFANLIKSNGVNRNASIPNMADLSTLAYNLKCYLIIREFACTLAIL